MGNRKAIIQARRRRVNRAANAGISIICALMVVVAFPCLASAVTDASPVKNERILVAIEGMHCTSCATGIKVMLKRTPGVISAEVSYERREVDVEYDPSRTSPDKIVEAISNMGYKASVKERREGRAAITIIAVSAPA